MPISLQCPECRRKLVAAEVVVGRKANCPSCGHPLVIQAGTETPDPQDSDSPSSEPLTLAPFDHSRFEDLVDMTAMVDIVFFLLVFFLVTAMQTMA